MLDRQERTTAGFRIRIEGSVQGVGFRPWVHEFAKRQAVTGQVWNESDCVTIEAYGDETDLQRFLAGLRSPPMPAARILDLVCESIPARHLKAFTIIPSRRDGHQQPSIPPDLAICEDCHHEIFDPCDRRYGYALTNCTRCGPRYTIALDVPYDRENTSMAAFPMCERCRAEYEDVADRRFHAQPIACPDCGPRLELVDHDGRALAGSPIEETARLLRAGLVIAVKGLGGYHLACDAASEEAVESLRARKHRYAKPLAIMVGSVEDADRVANLTDTERELLRSAARPIVLARRAAGCTLVCAVAPGTPLVGVMLPYTPLHELLLASFGNPLVMTSGNRSDEPICFDDEDALARLGGTIADALLRHDRAIVARCDDSIQRVLDGAAVVLRRARGLVPRSRRVSRVFPQPVLACGAHLKNSFCLGAGHLAWLGPHVGDLETDEACRGFEQSVERFSRFVGIKPEVVTHDLHPDYFSTRWAAMQTHCARIAVQHHHAHIASAMAEHDVNGPVLGLAWDGTGDGGDGTAWGGELLAADLAGFDRVATLRPLILAGGDTAIHEVWRLALALLDDAFDGDPPLARLPLFDRIDASRIATVRRMMATGLNAPRAHGAGRYFDAFGALLLERPVSRYEGEVAAALETAAAAGDERSYPFDVVSFDLAPPSSARDRPSTACADLRPTVRAVVADLISGTAIPLIAARFHMTMAVVADELIARAISRYGKLPVVLSGGCFQNERLLAGVSRRLERRTSVLRHREVPPNDGGIALGQAVIAASILRGERSRFGADCTGGN